MHLNLRGKILAYIALPVVLILGGAEIVRVVQGYQAARDLVIERETEFAKREATELDARLREVARVAKDTAMFLEVNHDTDRERLRELVRRNVAADVLVYGAAIAFSPEASPTGDRFAPYAYRAGPDRIQTMDIARDAYDYMAPRWQWWQLPLRVRDAVWTDVYEDTGAGKIKMVTFSAPFRRGDSIAGVATVDVALPTLRELVFDDEASRHKMFIIGRDERMVFAHNSEDIGTPLEAIAKKLERPDILELGRMILETASREPGHTVARAWDSSQQQLLFYAQVKSPQWVLGLRVDESAVFAAAHAQLRKAALVIVAALFVIIAGLVVVTRRVTAPIARLDAAARQVAQGDMNIDLPSSGGDEIARLSATFTDMARALVEREQALIAETAVREKIESELALAKELQRSMLPPAEAHDAAFGRYDVAAALEPARAVGGDFFNYVVTPDGRLIFVVADVSDKGVPAALFMVRAHTLMRSLAPRLVSPSELLAAMNDALCADNERCMFVTLVCGALDLSSGQLALANAGHEPPLQVRHDGQLAWIEVEGGPALGLIESMDYPLAERRLEPGDALILYTDGITEAFDSAQRGFGREGLEAAARSHAQASALELCAGVFAEVRRFVADAEQSDDITLLVVRWHGGKS